MRECGSHQLAVHGLVSPSGLEGFSVRGPVAYATGKDVPPSGLLKDSTNIPGNKPGFSRSWDVKKAALLMQNNSATALPGGP